MSANKNHHYLPKGYFRLFNGGTERINLLRKSDGEVFENAPIRSQAASTNFYFTQNADQQLSKLESNFLEIHKRLNDTIWTSTPTFTDNDLFGIRRAILIQRLRTRGSGERTLPASKYLSSIENQTESASKNNDLALEARSCVANSLLGIRSYINSLDDLEITFIRNTSNTPFLFSDDPVVFLNTYLRELKNLGTLGFYCRGLQVIYPISKSSAIMLTDPETYIVRTNEFRICDIQDSKSIKIINTLQLYQSYKCVFFSDSSPASYVRNLWKAHRYSLRFFPHVCEEFAQPGRNDTFLHTYEPQIPFHFNVNFIQVGRLKKLNPDTLWRRLPP